MTTNDADVLALEPCPFCGASLEAVARPTGLAVAYYFHPAVPCVLYGLEVYEHMLKEWNARALSRPVPEGFVLVPKEPTNEMIDAVKDHQRYTLRELWRALIAAAPSEREDR